MTKPDMPYWPRAMRLPTAAAYVDLSTNEFLMEVKNGVLPSGFRLGRSEHWDRWQIDKSLDQFSRVAEDWRVGSPLYADAHPTSAVPKTAPTPNPAGRLRAYSVATLAGHWEYSTSAIRKLIAKGELRAFRVGKLIRIMPDAVAEYEAAGHAVRPEQ